MKTALANIRYLHIVRGLAALLVVFFHSKYVFWVGGAVYNKEVGLHSVWDYILFSLDMLSSCGKECVIVFFILSAFVIKHSFSSHHYQWGNFYKLRLIRIYWPFLFSLVLSIIVLLVSVNYINPAIYSDFRGYNERLSGAYDGFSFGQVIKTIFFIDYGEYAGFNYAYWSLGYELIFYLLFPVYNKLGRYPQFIAAAILAGLFLLTGWHIFYYQVFFVAGLILYDYFSNFSKGPVIKYRVPYLALLALFFIAVNVSNKMVSEKFSDMVTLVFSFFIFDYILWFIRRKNILLMKLGDISYSLYLNHLPMLMLTYSLITLYTGQLVFYSRLPYYAGVVITVLLVIPLYFLTERPSITYLKKLRK
ncbi:MAG TPA: acyltransferase [Ferruginibacter sp.]|nr:acyltransferase [Ferruginibacter sp.]